MRHVYGTDLAVFPSDHRFAHGQGLLGQVAMDGCCPDILSPACLAMPSADRLNRWSIDGKILVEGSECDSSACCLIRLEPDPSWLQPISKFMSLKASRHHPRLSASPNG